MLKTYSTHILWNQDYPFAKKSLILPKFHHEVKISFPLQVPYTMKHFHQRIQYIADIQLLCDSLIKINGVIEQKHVNHFILIYEQIPYELEDMYELNIQISKMQTKILKLCQFLLQKRILPKFQSRYFGITCKNQLKYLLLPNFKQISNENQLHLQFDRLSQNVKSVVRNLKFQSLISPRETVDEDKISQRVSERDLSAYNKKFEQKIAKIQNKLCMSRIDRINSSQKLKRKKKMSQNLTEQRSASGSSSSQKSIKWNENKVKIYHQKNRLSYTKQQSKEYSRTEKQQFYKTSQQISKQSSSQQQNEQQSCNDNKVMKSSKLTNSLIIQEKNEEVEKLKHHKSSFGDYSTYGNESQKQQKLKRRISFALEKSKYALKVYEKYQTMKNSSFSNQIKG